MSGFQEMLNVSKKELGYDDDDAMTADEINSNNQTTFMFLEKLNELEDLKSEEAELTNAFKEDKAEQIRVNSALLDKVSKQKAGGARRRSSIFRR